MNDVANTHTLTQLVFVLLLSSMVLPHMVTAGGLDEGSGLQSFHAAPELYLQRCSMGPLRRSRFSEDGAERTIEHDLGSIVLSGMVGGRGWGRDRGPDCKGNDARVLGDSGGVVNSLDFCPASLKSLRCFYFWCVLSSQ